MCTADPTGALTLRAGALRFHRPAVAMAAPAPGLISVFSSPQELGASLAQLVVQRAACCLEGARARFALGLSGGSLVSMLSRDLPAAAAPAGSTNLARWTLGFCDERLVPFEHPESTYGLYRVSATGAAEGHAGKATPTAELQSLGAAVQATPTSVLGCGRRRQGHAHRRSSGLGPPQGHAHRRSSALGLSQGHAHRRSSALGLSQGHAHRRSSAPGPPQGHAHHLMFSLGGGCRGTACRRPRGFPAHRCAPQPRRGLWSRAFTACSLPWTLVPTDRDSLCLTDW
jgi:hypothetical protein